MPSAAESDDSCIQQPRSGLISRPVAMKGVCAAEAEYMHHIWNVQHDIAALPATYRGDLLQYSEQHMQCKCNQAYMASGFLGYFGQAEVLPVKTALVTPAPVFCIRHHIHLDHMSFCVALSFMPVPILYIRQHCTVSCCMRSVPQQ